VIVLGGVGYILSIVVQSYNDLQQYTAQGGTCSVTAMLPLAVLGLALGWHKYRS